MTNDDPNFQKLADIVDGIVSKIRTIKEEPKLQTTALDFAETAKASQNLKHAFHVISNGAMLPIQREALDLIATDLSRILVSAADDPKHWASIASYATMVQNLLTEGKETEPQPEPVVTKAPMPKQMPFGTVTADAGVLKRPVAPTASDRLEDGVMQPPAWDHITVTGTDGVIYFNVDRAHFSEGATAHLTKLRSKLNETEYRGLPPWYAPMYEQLSNTKGWTLQPRYATFWTFI